MDTNEGKSKMRFSTKVIVNAATLLSVLASTSLISLPVLSEEESEETCADLQRLATRVVKRQNSKVTFQGFESLPVNNNVYTQNRGNDTDRLCQLGYITTVSPMGKEICRGYIYTNIESSEIRWGIGPMSTGLFPPRISRSDYCRYIE
jgi:hypothetical protein